MKVYIRHEQDVLSEQLAEVTTSEQAETIAKSVHDHGAFNGDGVYQVVATQYLIGYKGMTGFEIIVGDAE